MGEGKVPICAIKEFLLIFKNKSALHNALTHFSSHSTLKALLSIITTNYIWQISEFSASWNEFFLLLLQDRSASSQHAELSILPHRSLPQATQLLWNSTIQSLSLLRCCIGLQSTPTNAVCQLPTTAIARSTRELQRVSSGTCSANL